jgi:hypothetical protein
MNDLSHAIANVTLGIESVPEPETGPRTWITNNQCDGWSDYDILMTYDPVEEIYSAVLVNLENVKSCVGYGRTIAEAQRDMDIRTREYRS